MYYGSTQYGVLPAGGPIVNPPDFNKPDLMEYLPRYYAEAAVAIGIQKSAAEEIGLLLYRIEDVLNQFFVDTATWGLSFWEYDFGLTVDPTKSVERRREQIKARIRGSGTVTRQLIIDTAAAFSGGEVAITEFPAESRFEIKFIGVKGIPANMPGFLAMLDEIKPAHLSHTIAYTYTTWNIVDSLTWSGAGAKTWNELRVYEGD